MIEIIAVNIHQNTSDETLEVKITISEVVMSGYSTIAGESMLQATGPYRHIVTGQGLGHIVMPNLSYQVGWSPIYEMSLNPPSSAYENYGTLSQLHPLVLEELLDSSYVAMLATENVLRREWDSLEEDAAWADL